MIQQFEVGLSHSVTQQCVYKCPPPPPRPHKLPVVPEQPRPCGNQWVCWSEQRCIQSLLNSSLHLILCKRDTVPGFQGERCDDGYVKKKEVFLHESIFVENPQSNSPPPLLWLRHCFLNNFSSTTLSAARSYTLLTYRGGLIAFLPAWLYHQSEFILSLLITR